MPYETNPIACYASLKEFKKSVTRATKQQVLGYVNAHGGMGPMHFLLDQASSKREETKQKIDFLLQHARRLGLDPNHRMDISGQAHAPAHVRWDNTPLHQCIAYENMDLVPFFLETAQKHGFEIDLNIQDNSGKSPLMFAIKIGWAPADVIRTLITPENYNMPDHAGMTPMMLACALRRTDIAALLVQAEADRLGLGSVDFNHPTPEQIAGLSEFLNQKHPKSGKTLGHYAVMRSGNRGEQAQKPVSYQETVLNILKAADVDGLRDENARYNCLTSPDREPLAIAHGIAGIPTQIAHIDVQDQSGQVFLNTLKNKSNLFQYDLGPLKPHFEAVFASFSGRSLVRAISEKTQAMVNFLGHLQFDFSVAQKNGKTIAGYVDGLKNPRFESHITTLDRDNLFNLDNIGRAPHPNGFFAATAAAAAPVDRQEEAPLNDEKAAVHPGNK